MTFFRVLSLTFLLLMVCLFPLHKVQAQGEHITFATTLLNQSPNPINQEFKRLIAQNQTPLIQAFIASGIDVNTIDQKRVSPIHYAAYFGHLDALRMLINRGANIHAAVFGGWTALHFSAFGGHVEASSLLISMGIPINVKDIGGETPIFYAIEGNHLKMVQWFVERGANLQHANNNGETPLSIANETGNKPIIEYLQKHDKQEPK